MAFYPFTALTTVPATYVGPSGDKTGATDTANINKIVQTAGGGTALLQDGTYYITNILIDSYSSITGMGAGTILQAVAGTTGYMIAVKTPSTTTQITLRSFTLIPNTGTLGGIQIDQTGWTFPGPPDPLHFMEDLLVWKAGGDGYHFDNYAAEMRVINCNAYDCAGNGFYLGNGPAESGTGCVDTRFVACTAGNCYGAHGFNIVGGGNCTFVACKAFGSGHNVAGSTWATTTACGFEIGSGCADAEFVGCTAQQNALHGFDLQGCSYVAMSGCDSDTNSAATGVTTGVGININGAQGCPIVGTTGTNLSLGDGANAYGIQVAGNNVGTWLVANTVTGTSGNYHYVSGGGAVLINPGAFVDLSSLWVNLAQVTLASASAQTLSNGNTIALNFTGGKGSATVTATGAVTGLILAQPNLFVTGQITIVSNESAFSLAFAASGTSAVANGASCIIQPHSSMLFYWDQATSLWYPIQPGSNTSASAPILTALGAVSGTGIQLSDTSRDYMVYLEVTTAGTATSLSIGHTSAASDVTLLTSIAVAAGDLFSFRLPAGWYFKWTGTTTAIGNQNAVGC